MGSFLYIRFRVEGGKGQEGDILMLGKTHERCKEAGKKLARHTGRIWALLGGNYILIVVVRSITLSVYSAFTGSSNSL